MPEVLDLKKVNRIVSSYEKRVESISSAFDTSPLFNDFQESFLDAKEEREKVNGELQDILAKKEHLRRKDFDKMMQGILAAQEQREREVRQSLKEYFNGQRAVAQALKENLRKFKEALAEGEVQRVKKSQALIKDILAKQEKRKEEITAKLKGSQKAGGDLALGLKELLAKGNELRIRDFKLMLKRFKTQQEEQLALQKKRKEEVAEMLRRFREKRQRPASSLKACLDGRKSSGEKVPLIKSIEKEEDKNGNS